MVEKSPKQIMCVPDGRGYDNKACIHPVVGRGPESAISQSDRGMLFILCLDMYYLRSQTFCT